ncbi:hypothetical protein A3I40_03655 [Candidatus Uhrbacteria bacterium RIFCSPLOWO2_02_FULL_48_12]|uniref:Uncharacterized protein n=1 Tax=Candidatus Uhrbacteria bacterium RIFCSPLOWO2_02_FULL_48_12 TaxID=1802407 RepID=A0A1F7V9W4_9BACT|nr:MAG: hypothetical protein A3I40_03655 [Candidatus Uhrbacteria bacterium RIFCSPLOWO2_02_FULL_48_12]
MEIESKQPRSKRSALQRGRQILERRKEIEQELMDMLKETDFGITPVAEQVRYGTCFPHKVLGGISPAEQLLEHHQPQK